MLAPLALLAVARKVSPGSLSAQKIRGAMRVVAYFGAVSAFALGYAAHVAKADVAEEQMTLGVRYVDRLERRDGGPWLIAHRVVMFDWERLERVTLPPAAMQAGFTRGSRDRNDIAYHI